MKEKDSKHKKRVRNLIMLGVLTAIIISVSTYAWFIGMKTVLVDTFEVKIATTESLWLSLDGETWSDTITISKNAHEGYSGSTNSWGGEGLAPVSTIGAMDTTASRMVLFEKASLTATPGGYRLMISRVPNWDTAENANVLTEPEPDGYVVFDLFVKNLSGRNYIPALNPLDEEAIYLTVDSEVAVGKDGSVVGVIGEDGTGIENSVRVAFTQVGRVKADQTVKSVITGLSCQDTTEADGTTPLTTGICREAQIWEPNDTAHVAAAIKWYDTSCNKRNATDSGEPGLVAADYSVGTSCGTVIDGRAYPTYAVNAPIAHTDKVDIYDGLAYNSYVGTTKLTDFDYFTDTEKNLRSVDRPQFMTLAPNSITKVRIYVYIEGQDVDNYDYAAVGRSISVQFGFTKQRFTEEDLEYEGPLLHQGLGPDGVDKTPPLIVFKDPTDPSVGAVDVDNPNILYWKKGETFVDPGATARDSGTTDTYSDINPPVATGTVNTDNEGTYYITYKATDIAGNVATKVRTVKVVTALP